MAAQLSQLHRQRPGRGATGAQHAAWLRSKATVSDAIAARARQAGDVQGAIRAEVAASRARIDARLLDRTESATRADSADRQLTSRRSQQRAASTAASSEAAAGA